MISEQRTSLAGGERNNYFDFLKFSLIFIVIWGHCIQALRSTDMSWEDNYFTVFTATFQMPLFILISGYFFSKSSKRQTYPTIALKKLRSV